MGQIYIEKFTIPFEMADVNGNLKLPSFLPKVLEVSGNHSAQLGRSDVDVWETYHLVWIVTDYEFIVDKLPRFGQEVQIRTEAVAYNKLICYRTFDIFDQDDQHLMTIKSYFALMNPETRKIVSVPEDLIAPYGSEKVKKIARSAKYTNLDGANQVEFFVRYFDIDRNGHVNNSKYLEWVYEVLGYDFLKGHQPRRIHLKYNREVTPGGKISSQYQLSNLTSQHQIVSDGQINAQAIVEWRTNDL